MPAMNRLPDLPTCCTALSGDWPLPIALPGCVWRCTKFSTANFTFEDFARSAIAAPASIQRSMAKRQAEFLAGRLCARDALLHLDGTLAPPAIGEDRAPVWPGHITGAITHSNGRAGALVAHKRDWQGLGIDLENMLSNGRAQRLANQILTPDELQRMAAGPTEDQALAVTLTFSIKESLFKALYPLVHKRFYFEHAQVLNWSKDGSVRLGLLTELSTEWYRGRVIEGQFALLDGHVLSAVAIKALPAPKSI